MQEHRMSVVAKKSFAGKYGCIYLLFLEEYMFVQDAINREKEIKRWPRQRKEELIVTQNPDWRFIDVY